MSISLVRYQLNVTFLTGDAVWDTNLDLAVMIENWYPKSTP